VEDPIRFQKSIRASIEHGHANCLTMEIVSVAFWHQLPPFGRLEPLPSLQDREPLPEISVVDVHRWRDAWRRLGG
ncbi:MAG: DUF2961 domain-containing protein, partial [Fimbriimonadaceae bacterium]|nr:DUF2961 domain-containing protein [Fimbriimonadaceae bacterium]